ncbi:hypothetical protein H7J73_08220 [Mycolicibacterium komossense]|uniref:Secreted protein n=1 Tax=Mycolicibacterium komossense TaxID=1779 RepID=A0ABT3C971_9MYCO|nr:hypothetical protein [Mycolicibacterium komossense]
MWLLAWAGVVALSGLTGITAAHAEPPPPCSFTLSAPEVVQVDGVAMVTATLGPDACGFPAGPSLSIACLQLQGVDTGGTCTQAHGSDPAQIYVPYRPGGTYASSGRGCPSWAGQSPAQWCQILGPVTATL